MHLAQEGDLVLLISQDRKQFIVRLQAGGQLQTHRGCVNHDDLLNQPLGREIRSHVDYPFVILEPSTCDLISELKRTTQIMYPKDIGYVLIKLNITPDSHVIEAGTGSGGLTLALARALGPAGRLYSYEVRPDVLRLAQKNLGSMGLTDRVELVTAGHRRRVRRDRRRCPLSGSTRSRALPAAGACGAKGRRFLWRYPAYNQSGI